MCFTKITDGFSDCSLNHVIVCSIQFALALRSMHLLHLQQQWDELVTAGLCAIVTLVNCLCLLMFQFRNWNSHNVNKQK